MSRLPADTADKLREAAKSEYKPKTSRELGIALDPQQPVHPRTIRSRIESLGMHNEIYGILNMNKTGATPDAAEEPEQTVNRTATDTTELIEAKGSRIKSVDDLVEAAEVDTDEWRIKSQEVKSWEVYSKQDGRLTQHAVKIFLERNREGRETAIYREALTDALKDFAPPPLQSYYRTPRANLAADILIPDPHIGKLAHIEESGANYDGKTAVQLFGNAVDQLIEPAALYNVSRILFPVGNDTLHIDGEDNATTAGTRQDSDSRFYRSIRRAVDVLLETVVKMMQVAPVDAIIIPGNHARLSEHMLGEILRVFGMTQPRLTLHDSPAPRKYLEHGRNLFGFTHGDGIKPDQLPMLMPNEAPQMWARTKHRFWSLGHTHKRDSKKYVQAIQETNGVEVRQPVIEVRTSPSLSASDSWHTGKGYVGNLRAAESHIYDEKAGEIARFRAVIDED